MPEGVTRSDLGQQYAFGIEQAFGNADAAVAEAPDFRVDMGEPRFGWREIPLREAVADTSRALLPTGRAEDAELGPASLVNMGNPHG